MSEFKVGDKVESTSVDDAGVGVVTAIKDNGDICVTFPTWYRHCVENPTRLRHAVSTGPVRTETVTKRRIVPGVYGRLEVSDRDGSELSIRLAWRTGPDEGELMHPMTATELDNLAMVASQLAEALRDVD